jgi:DNA mismatch repair protein MutS
MVKGIVKRGVTELVTPVLRSTSRFLIPKNNFLLSSQRKREIWDCFSRCFYGRNFVAEGNLEKLLHIVHTFDPAEIIYQRTAEIPSQLKNKNCFKLEDWAYQYNFAYEKLNSHFKTKSLKGFGIEEQKLGLQQLERFSLI